MADVLSEEESAARRAILHESLVPEKYLNLGLSKRGEAGATIRQYMRTDFKEDVSANRGVIFVTKVPALAQSFTRDIVLSKASAQFYYMQTFAMRVENMEHKPERFVIEWFEQEGMPSPFAPSQRYWLETYMTEMLEEGVLFYLFTPVHPEQSVWWSKSFIAHLVENMRVLGASGDGNERGGKGTSVRDPADKRQESPKGRSRVRVR
jgi:hypothetical protein